MKKHLTRLLSTLLATLLLVLALPATPAMAAADISPAFACMNLAATVRASLRLPAGAPITAAQAATVTHLDASRRGVTSLVGIQHLTNLLVFDVSENTLATADFSAVPSLLRVSVSRNPLTSLNIAQNTNLTQLNAAQTQLTTLNTAQNSRLQNLQIPSNPQLTTWSVAQNRELVTLNVADNALATLNVVNNTALEVLVAAHNELESLSVSHLGLLQFLDVAHNRLTSLDLQGLRELSTLDAGHNQLRSLDLSPAPWLMSLNVENNQISSLNTSAALMLFHLDASNNSLLELQVSDNEMLQRLNVANNQLAFLDVERNHDLVTLDASGNQLTSLDLRNNTRLYELNVSHNRLEALDITGLNVLHDLDVSYNRMPSQQAITGLQPDNLFYFTFHPQQPVGTDITGSFTCEVLLNALRDVMQLGDDSPILAEQASLVTNLNLFNQSITRIDGLQYFSVLERVNLAYNNLTHADFAMLPSLREVDVSNNELISLHVSGNANLERLWASRNHLEHLNLQSNPALHTLDVSGNLLASLDVSRNMALTNLNASRNLLTSLDLGANEALRTLDVRYNFMADVSAVQLHPQAFSSTFRFHPQRGSDHDVSRFFACANFLATVREYLNLDATDPVTPANLQQIITLDVSGQGITSLAGLSFLTNLQRLYAANNTVANVDMTNNRSLTYLDVRGNWLESRDVITGLRVGVLLRFDPQAFNGRNVTAQFACENFLAAVREAMGLTDGAQIGAGDALTVTELNLAGRSITNTAGIANFANLTTLNLANNPLRHLDLSSNIALQNLNVSGGCLNTLNLQNNINLTQLQASRNHLTQLNLTTNTQLQSVDIRQNFMESTGVIQLSSTPTVQFNPQHSRVVVAPTCTVRGFTIWTSHCGHTLITNETAPPGHFFTSVVTPSTFTQRGFTTRTCTRCGYSYIINWLPPIALDYAPMLTLRHRQATTVFSDIAHDFPQLTWHSSNPEVMTVDELGQVSYGRAPRRGTTTITAICAEGVTRMQVEVTVRLAWWQWIIIVAFFGWY